MSAKTCQALQLSVHRMPAHSVSVDEAYGDAYRFLDSMFFFSRAVLFVKMFLASKTNNFFFKIQKVCMHGMLRGSRTLCVSVDEAYDDAYRF